MARLQRKHLDPAFKVGKGHLAIAAESLSGYPDESSILGDTKIHRTGQLIARKIVDDRKRRTFNLKAA